MSLSLTDPLNPNAPEFIPEAEQQRRANRANNAR
jgi:hypothetical protein